jgi:hypothetical protein
MTEQDYKECLARIENRKKLKAFEESLKKDRKESLLYCRLGYIHPDCTAPSKGVFHTAGDCFQEMQHYAGY